MTTTQTRRITATVERAATEDATYETALNEVYMAFGLTNEDMEFTGEKIDLVSAHYEWEVTA